MSTITYDLAMKAIKAAREVVLNDLVWESAKGSPVEGHLSGPTSLMVASLIEILDRIDPTWRER